MSDSNPWLDIVDAKNRLSTAGNYLDDAVGAMAKQEPPVTEEQAAQRREEVRQRLADAERELQRARRKLDLVQEDD